MTQERYVWSAFLWSLVKVNHVAMAAAAAAAASPYDLTRGERAKEEGECLPRQYLPLIAATATIGEMMRWKAARRAEKDYLRPHMPCGLFYQLIYPTGR